MTIALTVTVFSQNKTANQIDPSKEWIKADYTGMYKGKIAYDIYYKKDSVASSVVYVNIMRVYNAHALSNYSELGLKSTSMVAETTLIGVDISRGWYWVISETRFYKNGEKLSSKKENIGYIYPDEGTEGEYYLVLAKKIKK